MKKKISSKLTLGKRSVAALSDDSMAQVNAGGYVSDVVKCPSAWCGYGTCLATGSCSR